MQNLFGKEKMKTIKEKMKTIKLAWVAWLFPIFAIVITIYLVKQHFYNRGPMIQISFEEASMVQVEKTRLRYRGVNIGTVKKVAISEDQKNVTVSVLLIKEAAEFAVEGSKFWIITPQVSLQGLTGLDTIFGGPYIEVQPGPMDGSRQTEFKGREDSDTHEATENTSPYIIETANAESISKGDAVTFRGMVIGNIGKLTLNKTAQAVEIQLNIQNKYTKLIRTNTVFWRKVGIQAKLGLFGSQIKVNSFDSIMRGGVELAIPDHPGEVAKARARFALVPEAPKDYSKWNPKLDL